MNWIPVIVSAAVAIAVSVLGFAVQFGGMRARLKYLEQELQLLRKRVDNLGDGLSAAREGILRSVAPIAAKLEVYEKLVIPKGNPITQAELSEFRRIRNKIVHGVELTKDELQRFHVLSRKILEDLPKDKQTEFASLTAEVGGLILGALLLDMITNRPRKRTAYRRRKGGDAWHWCRNCSTWPTSDYDERYTKPTSGELCNECKHKEKNGTCRK